MPKRVTKDRFVNKFERKAWCHYRKDEKLKITLRCKAQCQMLRKSIKNASKIFRFTSSIKEMSLNKALQYVKQFNDNHKETNIMDDFTGLDKHYDNKKQTMKAVKGWRNQNTCKYGKNFFKDMFEGTAKLAQNISNSIHPNDKHRCKLLEQYLISAFHFNLCVERVTFKKKNTRSVSLIPKNSTRYDLKKILANYVENRIFRKPLSENIKAYGEYHKDQKTSRMNTYLQLCANNMQYMNNNDNENDSDDSDDQDNIIENHYDDNNSTNSSSSSSSDTDSNSDSNSENDGEHDNDIEMNHVNNDNNINNNNNNNTNSNNNNSNNNPMNVFEYNPNINNNNNNNMVNHVQPYICTSGIINDELMSNNPFHYDVNTYDDSQMFQMNICSNIMDCQPIQLRDLMESESLSSLGSQDNMNNNNNNNNNSPTMIMNPYNGGEQILQSLERIVDSVSHVNWTENQWSSFQNAVGKLNQHNYFDIGNDLPFTNDEDHFSLFNLQLFE